MVSNSHKRPIQGVAFVLGIVLVTAACSSDDGNDPESGPAPEPVTGLAAEPSDGGGVGLTWDTSGEAQAYRISVGEDVIEVPAEVCDADGCGLAVTPQLATGPQELTVSAVRDDAASEPASVTAEIPAEESVEPFDEENLEVVLVHAARGDEPPEVETVPVDDIEEARDLIEQSLKPGEDDDIVSADLNISGRPNEQMADGESSGGESGDGEVSSTWYTDAMSYDLLPGDSPGDGVTVAVIEPGHVDDEHPSFEGVDQADDINTFDPAGLDVTSSHKTGVASMIFGQPSGAVPGIAPGATLMDVDVGEEGGAESAGVDDGVEGIKAAVDAGADVINISYSWECLSINGWEVPCAASGIDDGIKYAEEHGVVVVASAGNNGGGHEGCDDPTDAKLRPAIYDTVISVGGIGPHGDVWVCSPDRPDVDVLAPASHLLNAAPEGQYSVDAGTSLASPLVAGLIAVILAEKPDLTPAQIRAMLPQWRLANGSINVAAALVTAGVITGEPPVDIDNLAGAYPYHADFRFPAGHAITDAFYEDDPVYEDLGGLTTLGWIDGVVFVDEDGSASASGVARLQSDGGGRQIGGPDWTAGAGVHRTICRSDGFIPDWWVGFDGERVFRWDIPVTVDVDVVSAAEGQPAFELAFSLGVGATPTSPGSLPPVVDVQNELEQCAALADWRAAGGAGILASSDVPSGDDVIAEAEDYFAQMERVNQMFIDASPFTLADPGTPAVDLVPTTLSDDPQVEVSYYDINAYRELLESQGATQGP